MSSVLVTNNNRNVKMQRRMVIPQELDENRWLYFICQH